MRRIKATKTDWIISMLIIALALVVTGLVILNTIQGNKKIIYNEVEITHRDYKIINEKIDEPFVVCNMENGNCNLFYDINQGG